MNMWLNRVLVYSFFTVLVGFQLAFARMTVPESTMKRPSGIVDSRTEGVFVEANYFMLRTEGSSNHLVANPTVILNGTLYTAGFGLGYRLLRPMNIGFETGVQVIQESGRIGTDKSAFYQLNASLTYSLNSKVFGFVGPNLNYLNYTNRENMNINAKTNPAFGGQIGLGYIFKGFFGKIGYQYMQIASDLEYRRTAFEVYTINNNFNMSGITSHIGYNF